MHGKASTTPVPAGIVVHRPDTEVLGLLLQRLASHGRRLFVFVNGCLDDRADGLMGSISGARLIRSSENVGLGAGLNAIAEAAIGEGFSHLMLFDQDSEPASELPEQLLARWTAANTNGARLAVVGPLLIPPAQGHYRQIRYFWRSTRWPGSLACVHFAPTSGSLVCLAAFRAIGPFRDDFFIGGIDVEWGFRAWSRGYGSAIARDLTMVHRWGEAASPSAARTPQMLRHAGLRRYYYVRNAIYSLRLPFIPLSWRVRYTARLCAQIGYLGIHGGIQGRGLRRTGSVMFAAFRDGATGRLGPVPPDLPKDVLE